MLSFLGIEIDTADMVFRLPREKLEKLRDLIAGFLALKSVTLNTSLVFACRVMPMGRVFSRRLSLATRGVLRAEHRIRLTRTLKDDLRVWESFLQRYRSNGEISLYTDADGSRGFGAIFGLQWCAGAWPDSWVQVGWCKNLTLLELFPVVVAVELWVRQLRDSKVCFWTDNVSVVACVNSLPASSLPVLALLRHLVLRYLELNILFRARHVPGVENKIADALSRFYWQEFQYLLPGAASEGLPCPSLTWDLVTQG